MARKLSTFVTVHERNDEGEPTGRSETYGPNDTLPAWAEKAITNPDVWADAEQASAPAEPVVDQDGPPPKGGAGSGAPAWREYAARNDVEVASDASRENVVAALDAAGVRTE